MSNLSALGEVIRCLSIYPNAGITSELCRFLACPTALGLDVLCGKLYRVCDDLDIVEFRDWGVGLCKVPLDTILVDNS